MTLPPAGHYAAGLVFLPAEAGDGAKAQRRIEELADEEHMEVLAWRDVPVQPEGLGETARRAMPLIRQVVIAPRGGLAAGLSTAEAGLAVDRLAFCLRKRIEHEVPGVYVSVAVGPDASSTRACSRAPAAELLPGPLRPGVRERSRPGPLPLLNEHVPVVAAGAPLPLRGTQRRDQHLARQPQLDARP